MWRSNKSRDAVLNIFNSESELIVFDTETTGLSPTKNRVIQFSGIKFDIEGGKMVERERCDLYINPREPLPPKITEITGITDEALADAPCERDAFPVIFNFLGKSPCVCGHNTPFDIRFMNAMYERNGCEFLPSVALDTLEMARDLSDGVSESNKLGDLARHYGVDAGLTFHNSLDDVIACSRLLIVFADEYKSRAESEPKPFLNIPKTRANIYKMRYWAGYRGHSRIYIYTDLGDFYYDVYKKVWGKGQNNVYNIEQIDMEALREDALKFVKVADEREFARYRG